MKLILSVLCMVFPAFMFAGSSFHVATNGSSGNSGSSSSPWDLASALNQPSAVHPGDTIWVHGGTYAGTFSTNLNGTSSLPIIVRNWNNERATIDGGNSNGNPIVSLGGSYTWYWGLEITSSATNKISTQATSWPTDIMYGEGIMIKQGGTDGTGCKFINLVIHDTRQAMSSWKEAANSEVFGCIVYDNGWQGSDRPHGHNFYIQNVNGTKLFADNFILRAYSHNIQSYGSTASNEDNEVFDGNVGVNGGERNFMLGGDNLAHNPMFTNNVMYSDGARAGTNNFYLGYPTGYSPGTTGAVVNGNYFAGGSLTFNLNANMTFSGNTVYNTGLIGDVPNLSGNTVTTTPPSTDAVILRPNKYDPSRANVVILNWSGKSSVSVDISSIVRTGSPYVIRDAQNYFGAPVASGTYSGGAISIPMTGTTMPATVGNDPRGATHTGQSFGTFVVSGSASPAGLAQAPTATTSAATAITANAATLNGSVNPNGTSTTYHFDYGTTASYGSSTTTVSAGAGTSSAAVNAAISGLVPATLYHYRIVATSSAGTTNSIDATLTTAAPAATPPVVSTSAATGITTTGAQLNGQVNPSGTSTTYHFDYGTTTSYGSSTATANAGAGTASAAVSAALTGLTSATIYHYRIVASNSAGTTNGSDVTLTTATPAGVPPVVVLSAASGITPTGAQLNGLVNPSSFSTSYHFDYGTTTSYGSSTPPASAGAGATSLSVSSIVSGLNPTTLYHYRLVATNSGGTTNSTDGTLTTGVPAGIPPVATSSSVTGITATGAQLNGAVNPSGFSTMYHFDYGTTTSYGSSTASVNAGAGTSSTVASALLSGLTPSTLYHYRIVASNSGGTTTGSDGTLTTAVGAPAPALPVVATLAPSVVNATGATLVGTVNPNGLSTAYHFEYGLTGSYGISTTSGDAGSGSVTDTVSVVLTNLTPGTLYHYRLVAASAAGTVNGTDMTLTSQAAAVKPGHGRDPHKLAQNYPNPFNPSTEIQYDLLVASDVSMKVYNTLGAEVATLVSGFQDAGTHLVRWDGTGFVSGIYFCVLKSGGMVSTRRMILLR